MKEKDWNGNKKTTFVTLGASNHSEKEREKDDFYATDPHSLEIFLKKQKKIILNYIKVYGNVLVGKVIYLKF